MKENTLLAYENMTARCKKRDWAQKEQECSLNYEKEERACILGQHKFY